MIDTGSTISAVTPGYLKKIHHGTIYPATKVCKSANNSSLDILGIVELTIMVLNITTQVKAYIIENLCTDVLLGNDWCNEYNVDISYSLNNLTIWVGNKCARVPFSRQISDSKPVHLRTSEDIVIPPRSAKVIQATTNVKELTAAIFTPSTTLLMKEDICAPYALLRVDQYHTTLSLMNISNTPRTIFKGTQLGTLMEHHNERCCYVNTTTEDHMEHVPSSTTTKKSASFRLRVGSLLSHLSKHQQQHLQPILLKHSTVFDISKPTVMNINTKHRIPIQEHHAPIQSYPYRKAPKEREIINEQVAEMLKNNVIRPSSSPWSSPVVIVKKKDGKPRFCVDYRRLNHITERDVYPLPRIDDIIDRLAGAKYFTTLDMKQGYWQVPIEEKDKNKTAFVTSEGLFEFNVLPFGLSNAPATFQRIVNSILGALRWEIALVYLDDVIIYSRSIVEHAQHLDAVLCALQEANIKLNAEKCSICKKELDYLGFRITSDGIKPTRINVRKTIDFPVPTSAKQAYAFVQMAQFYRRFIPNFATIAAPLNVFRNNNIDFVWTNQCQQAFDELKTRLSQYPLLAYPDDRSTFRLSINTDASNTGIGGVLHQITPQGPKPITYLSRSLSTQEKKFSTVEKECLALVWCITKLRHYLYGCDFDVLTDHHPLCWLNKRASKNGRLDRWAVQLQEFRFNIKHTSGKCNNVADCLSRYPLNDPDDIVEANIDLMHGQNTATISAIITDTNPIFNPVDIRAAQVNDNKMKHIMESLASGSNIKSFCLKDNVLCKMVQRQGQPTLTLPFVPKSMRHNLLVAYHDHPTGGHLGVYKTWCKIKDRYYWPGQYSDVKNHVLSCKPCQQFKICRKKPTGLLQPIEQPAGVMDLLGLDFIGPVPMSSRGNQYILVCTDYLSKYCITEPTKDCSATTAARFLVERVILHYGVPKQLLTDQGTHFMAKVFEAVALRCGVHHITATTYHPSTNGLTERLNATIANSIGPYVNQQQSDWDEYLPFVTYSYNTSKQTSTQIEPYKLMFGRVPRLPFDMPNTTVVLPTPNDYFVQLDRFLNQAKHVARCNVKKQQNIYKRRFDTGRIDQKFSIGQHVWLKQMMNHKLKKFSPKYYGPFQIEQQHGRLNYVVRSPHDGRTETVHVSRLKPV